MKYIFLLLFLAVGSNLWAQNVPSTENVNVPTGKNNAVLAQQKLTRLGFPANIVNNPAEASLWLQYYKQTDQQDYSNADDRKKIQSTILNEATSFISNSWQLPLMQFLFSNKRDRALLESALNISHNKKEIYPYAIQHGIITGDANFTSTYAFAQHEASPLSDLLYEYHYNSLMSAAPNATIYAKGLQDLVPLAVLQQVFLVRKDIVLKYYENKLAPAAPNTYICLSAGKDVIAQYPNAVYTGLLVKLQANKSVDELEQHLQQNFTLTGLEHATELSEAEKKIYRNYLPSFLLLYKQYQQSQDSRASDWLKTIIKLASLTGDTLKVNQQLGTTL
jgi:hypothetical protein